MIRGDERELLARTLSQAVESATRAPNSAEALDSTLREVGWRHALDDDPQTAVTLLLELQGGACVTSSALDAVLTLSLGGDASTDVSVILPVIGRTDPPGRQSDDGMSARGLATSMVRHARIAWVMCEGNEGSVCVAVPTEELTLCAVRGLDPDLGLTEVTAERVHTGDAPPSSSDAWAEAIRLGQLAIAHELVGASRTMLQLARDHAVERIQFGQPIARFQAVRHRLADALVAVETASAAADAAWEDASVLAAAAAKAIAGRNARAVAGHAQQVLAGIGFTTEHPLHRYVRRVLVLDALLGDSRSLTQAMGAELLATKQLPPLVPL